MTPHPQRCETCTHLKKHEIHNLYCEISGRKTPHGTLFMERVAELGCASHSSRPHTPAPDCNNCSYKRFAANWKNAEAREATIRNDERNQTLDDIEEMMNDGIHYTDYSGTTISLPVERWDEIIESLRHSTEAKK